MSSQRGNVKKSGPPKHQNKRAFKNNMHDKTKKIQMINSLQLGGLCKSCKDVIDWKIKYKKYKPLSQPKTCIKCSQKTVKRAYYTVCQPCSTTLKICGKCAKDKEIIEQPGLTPEEEAAEQTLFENELKFLPERERRALLRKSKAGNRMPEDATAGSAGDEGEDSDCSDVGHTDSDHVAESDTEDETNNPTADASVENPIDCTEDNLEETKTLDALHLED